jgi:hypothetical protein
MENSMTSTTSAVRNGILCILNLQGPLHFRNAGRIQLSGEQFSKFNVAEKHHIFPVGFLRQQGYSSRDVHRVPNFCFIPEELNKWIADRPPSQYMREIRDEIGEDQFQAVMTSHLIPVGENSGIWTDDYQRFLRQRAELLLGAITHRCGVSDEITLEYRNPLVDAIENALREAIHTKLQARHGFDYWQQCVDKAVAKKVNDRIEEHVQRTRGSKLDLDQPRARMEFCDVTDYVKIVEANWSEFAGVFHKRDDFTRNLDDFREYRNAVKHNRQTDTALEYQAKAAMIWLSRSLGLDLSKYDIVF